MSLTTLSPPPVGTGGLGGGERVDDRGQVAAEEAPHARDRDRGLHRCLRRAGTRHLSWQAMASITVFHNPNCSKSRGACQILDEAGADFDSVQYLKTPPTREEIIAIVEMLDDPPAALVRKDPYFKELGLDAAELAQLRSDGAFG